MAPTAQGQNTQTATVTTEHTLLDVAVAGVFQLKVDIPAAFVAGDVVELRVYTIILTGGTRHVEQYVRLEGPVAADEAIWYSDPVMNELTDSGSVRFTLLQTKGTGRSFPWKVLKA